MKSIDELVTELPLGTLIDIEGEPYVLQYRNREWNPDPTQDRFYKLTLTFVHATEAVITESLLKFDS
jgi:hypothetical protein